LSPEPCALLVSWSLYLLSFPTYFPGNDPVHTSIRIYYKPGVHLTEDYLYNTGVRVIKRGYCLIASVYHFIQPVLLQHPATNLYTVFLQTTMPVTSLYCNSQEFISKLRTKDRVCFEQLYDMYAGAIFSTLLGIVKDKQTAEDMLQESFFKVWKNIESFDPSKASIYTWLLNISRNTALDYLRRTNVRRNISGDQERAAEPVVNSINTNTIGLDKSFKYLTDEQTQVIKAVYYNGLTYQEAAEVLQIPLGTVKSRMRNALITLKNVFVK
jgi:RNA polymerase sigma-70 factor (ECF subfamily)